MRLRSSARSCFWICVAFLFAGIHKHCICACSPVRSFFGHTSQYLTFLVPNSVILRSPSQRHELLLNVNRLPKPQTEAFKPNKVRLNFPTVQTQSSETQTYKHINYEFSTRITSTVRWSTRAWRRTGHGSKSSLLPWWCGHLQQTPECIAVGWFVLILFRCLLFGVIFQCSGTMLQARNSG